jgi:hypothetical protein
MLRHALEVFLIDCRIPGTGSFHPYRQTHYAEVFGINKYNTIELPGSHASHLALTILPSSKVDMPRKTSLHTYRQTVGAELGLPQILLK